MDCSSTTEAGVPGKGNPPKCMSQGRGVGLVESKLDTKYGHYAGSCRWSLFMLVAGKRRVQGRAWCLATPLFLEGFL